MQVPQLEVEGVFNLSLYQGGLIRCRVIRYECQRRNPLQTKKKKDERHGRKRTQKLS